MDNQPDDRPLQDEAREDESEQDVLDEGGTIDAGTVADLDRNPPEIKPPTHRAKTASKLAYVLVAILGLTIAVHYFAVLILSLRQRTETAEALSQIFDKWLPVITGFVGGAVTYYFTREK